MFSSISTNTNDSHIPRHLIAKLKEVFRGDKDVRRSLRQLLKSNAAPSDPEVIAIRALINDAEACIEELHCRSPSRVRAFKESQLLKSIEVHRALLSPVRYLPSEILQEIFLHYADHRGPITLAKIPWRLGHISHRWRKVALSLPSLWDDIPQVNILFEKPKESEVRALICLIQRSGTSPTLKFDITSSGSLRDVFKSAIANEIILHSKRIEQLYMTINKTIMPFFQELNGRLPNLRLLRVYIDDAPDLDAFEAAAALDQFAEEIDYSSRCRVLLPCSRMVHFKDHITVNALFRFLSTVKFVDKF